jgi:hypothetical protein
LDAIRLLGPEAIRLIPYKFQNLSSDGIWHTLAP